MPDEAEFVIYDESTDNPIWGFEYPEDAARWREILLNESSPRPRFWTEGQT